MLSVIIVSAGKSTRMKGINKQFLEICSAPVLIRSISAFDNIDGVSEIIVVTNNDNINATNELIKKYYFDKEIKITEGGNTRQQSVLNGYKLVSKKCDYVAIHDGARPLISQKVIRDAIENANKYKATAVGVPVKDTIKFINNGYIESTLNRDRLFKIQTPQKFENALYSKGLQNAVDNNLDFTDDCQLIEAIGEKVFMTIGEYSNIKITTPDDVAIAENYLKDVLL